jgi:hypothetical protein
MGQSRMNIPETQVTLGTRNRTKTNKTKRHKQHWAQETERRQTKQRDTNNIGQQETERRQTKQTQTTLGTRNKTFIKTKYTIGD